MQLPIFSSLTALTCLRIIAGGLMLFAWVAKITALFYVG